MDRHLVAADHHAAGVPRRDHGCLLACQAQRQGSRLLVVPGRFVDVRGVASERQAQLRQEAGPVGGGGREHEFSLHGVARPLEAE